MLVIPEHVRRDVCARVLEAVKNMTGTYGSVGLPELGGSAILNSPSLFGGPHVVLAISPELSAHAEDVEQFVRNAIGDKVEQSTRGDWPTDTVLVVDASRLGLGWLRPDSVWAGRLEAMDLPWTELPFSAVAVVFSDLTKVGYHGSCVTRPDLAEISAVTVAPLLRSLRFDMTTG
jgi:hypothetical protein